MKEWLKSYFYVPKHGKVRERTMMGRLTLTVAVIVGCLIAMSVSAYAYFSCSMFSGSNVIQSARFETSVTMKDANGNEVTPITRTPQGYRADLKEGIDYYVTVSFGENNTASTGYFLLSAVDCDTTYHTQQLLANTEESFSFVITVDQDTQVELTSAWGTSSLYSTPEDPRYITADERVELIIKPDVANTIDSENGSESEDPTDAENGAESEDTTDTEDGFETEDIIGTEDNLDTEVNTDTESQGSTSTPTSEEIDDSLSDQTTDTGAPDQTTDTGTSDQTTDTGTSEE